MTDTKEAIDTAQQLIDIAGTYGDEMAKHIDDNAERASTNWLYAFGIPKTPAEVRQLVHVVYKGAVAAIIHEGYIEVSEKGLASEEEKAEREEAKTGQTNLFTSLDAETFGQYL